MSVPSFLIDSVSALTEMYIYPLHFLIMQVKPRPCPGAVEQQPDRAIVQATHRACYEGTGLKCGRPGLRQAQHPVTAQPRTGADARSMLQSGTLRGNAPQPHGNQASREKREVGQT